jgi:hypothetical protein
MLGKYRLPDFLNGAVPSEIYARWLFVKADSHFRRDRNRGNQTATREAYKIAVHEAVLVSGGLDHYTGEKLDWSLLCKWDNEESKKKRREYKARFAALPTVDHVGDGLGKADFKIIGWRTNDAKSDLTHDDFVQLCRRVVSHFGANAEQGVN